ncbi:hypothetical protein V5799_027875 [Amblyomma americanum]|uniref:Peptidase S54 rhomboid domain-containing protein n=1 Tax=Amblyomma americanum TaxID=6943 RepID=A0AAQ4DEG8_AMBAM
MSQEGSMERTVQEHEEKPESVFSSVNAAPADAVSDDAKPSTSAEIAAATKEPSSEPPGGKEPQSFHFAGYGASQATSESVTLVPSASSSKLHVSEASAPHFEPSEPLPMPSRDLPQTPKSATAMTSLTLLVPTGKHQEEKARVAVKLPSPLDGEPGTPAEVPVSPKTQETPPTKYSFSSSIWDAFSLGAPKTGSHAQSLTSSSVPGSDKPQEFTEPTPQSKSLLHGGPSVPTAAADGTRTMTIEVKAESSEQSRAVLSPRNIVPWSCTPRRIEKKRETPEVAQEPLSPMSPVSVSSPGSLPSPRRTKAAYSHLLRDETYVPPRVPWATLIVTWLQVQSHWNFLHKHYPERCASVVTIVDDRHWERAPLAAFHHENVVHLASNLVSFFVKAFVLEAALGMTYFTAVLTIAIVLVGLVNTFIVAVASEFIKASPVRTMCSHTFAGVVVVLDMLARKHFSHSVIHYGPLVFNIWPLASMVVESFTLVMFSGKNLLPMVSGLLVGAFLAGTAAGNFIISVRYPRQHLHLCVVPKAPVTFLFAISIMAAYVYGPYPRPPAVAKSALTFRYPVWSLPGIRTLYLPNVFMMGYVIMSLLPVGAKLELEIGHYRFLGLVIGLLFAMNISLDSLAWVIWKHIIALRTEGPAPAPHSLSCGCGLVGVLLALKVIHHMRHPQSDYQMASFPIPVPFWAGVLMELAHLGCSMPQGSTFGHVTGVVLGLAVGHCRSEYFVNCIPGVGSFSASSTPQYRSESLPQH